MKLQHKYNKVLFVLLKRTLNDDFFKGKIHMNPSKDLLSKNLTRFLRNGFQGQLMETHRLAIFASSHIIGSIHSWNLTTLKTWMVLQGMSMS
jgi:hypothetical protein